MAQTIAFTSISTGCLEVFPSSQLTLIVQNAGPGAYVIQTNKGYTNTVYTTLVDANAAVTAIIAAVNTPIDISSF